MKRIVRRRALLRSQVCPLRFLFAILDDNCVFKNLNLVFFSTTGGNVYP